MFLLHIISRFKANYAFIVTVSISTVRHFSSSLSLAQWFCRHSGSHMWFINIVMDWTRAGLTLLISYQFFYQLFLCLREHCLSYQILIVQFAENKNNISNNKMRLCVQIPASQWALLCLVIAFPYAIAAAKQTAYVIFGFLKVSLGIKKCFFFLRCQLHLALRIQC